MNRLQAELQRLHFLPDAAAPAPLPAAGDARTRPVVLAVSGPGSWDLLARVWQGVQAELELPAPAIAVNGLDGYQLWFALAEPLEPQRAREFLHGLRARYLAEAPPARIAMHPGDGFAGGAVLVPERAPPVEMGPGQWSAFVAPDLAALFADEPWLDLAPAADAQAELLARVQVTQAAELARALQRLVPAEDAGPAGSRAGLTVAGGGGPAGAPAAAAPPDHGPPPDPRDQRDDRSVDLRLRIEAAKALLPCFEAQRVR